MGCPSHAARALARPNPRLPSDDVFTGNTHPKKKWSENVTLCGQNQWVEVWTWDKSTNHTNWVQLNTNASGSWSFSGQSLSESPHNLSRMDDEMTFYPFTWWQWIVKGPKHYIKLIAPKTKMEAICTGNAWPLFSFHKYLQVVSPLVFNIKITANCYRITMNMAKKTPPPQVSQA